MILLIAIPVWILAVSLIAGLCAASRRGDIEHAMLLAGHSGEVAMQEHRESFRSTLGSRHGSTPRQRAAEGSVLSHSSSAAA